MLQLGLANGPWNNRKIERIPMHRIAGLIVLFGLAGCAPSWNLNGKSDADFRRDQGACRSEANAAMVKVADMTMRSGNDRLYNRCMESKGYTARTF